MLLNFKLCIVFVSLLSICRGTVFGLSIDNDDYSKYASLSSVSCIEYTCLAPFSTVEKTFSGSPNDTGFSILKKKGGNVQSLITRTTVTFKKNSDRVDHEFLPYIQSIANILLDNPESMVLLIGHTDSSGNESFNQKLSMKRTENVKKLLVKKGVDFHRIATRGYGSLQPVASNDISANRRKNRRVEIIIIPSDDITSLSAVTHANGTDSPHDISEAEVSRVERHDHNFQNDSQTGSGPDTVESNTFTMTEDKSGRDLKTDNSQQRDNREDNDFAGVDDEEHIDARNGKGDSSDDAADEESLIALNNALILLYNNGEYAEAGAVIEKSLRTAKKRNKHLSKDSLKALENIAKICYSLDKIKKAEILFNELLKRLIASGYGNDVYIAMTMYNLGATARIMKEYGKAEFYYQAASNTLRKINKFHPFRAIIMEELVSISNMNNYLSDDKKYTNKIRYKRIATAIRQRDPSIDFFESNDFRKCNSTSMDIELCQMFQQSRDHNSKN